MHNGARKSLLLIHGDSTHHTGIGEQLLEDGRNRGEKPLVETELDIGCDEDNCTVVKPKFAIPLKILSIVRPLVRMPCAATRSTRLDSGAFWVVWLRFSLCWW